MSDQQGMTPPGALVQPGPVSFAIGSMPIQDGSKLVVLRIEHTVGTTVVHMPQELAKQVGQGLIENATGLTLAKPGDLPG